MFLSRRTVQTYISHILAKLGAKGRVEIVREALSDYRARTERGDADSSGDGGNRALMERFRSGLGVDLEVLRDENGEMWGHDR